MHDGLTMLHSLYYLCPLLHEPSQAIHILVKSVVSVSWDPALLVLVSEEMEVQVYLCEVNWSNVYIIIRELRNSFHFAVLDTDWLSHFSFIVGTWMVKG